MTLKHLGVWLFVLGVVLTVSVVVVPGQSTLRQRWRRYEAWLDSECRRLFLPTNGRTIGRSQVLLGVIGGTMLLTPELMKPAGLIRVLTSPSAWSLPLLFVLIIAAAPYLFMQYESRKRVNTIEGQVDGWLQLLANALTAGPALGQAIDSTQPLVQRPLSQEVDLVIKELHLGTPLDQALLALSSRVGSRSLNMALSAILIGRRTGGDLATILKRSAESFREMQRLEGVVRTKTAEARIQIAVIAVLPLLAIFGLEFIRAGHFEPLIESPIGGILAGAAIVTWLASLLWARQILMVRL